MALPDAIKGAFLKSALKYATNGDSGSTSLGLIAAALLGANLDFSRLSQGFHTTPGAEEIGKAFAIVVITIWGIYIGKGKTPAEPTPKP